MDLSPSSPPPKWIVERAQHIAMTTYPNLDAAVAAMVELAQDAGREVAFYFAAKPGADADDTLDA